MPKRDSATTPYYGMVGGAYHFHFMAQAADTLLRVEHVSGNRLNLHPYEISLGTLAQFAFTEQPTRHWDGNRLESLMEDRYRDFYFYIDGDMYANLLASGWNKETRHYYRYEFAPLTVGCMIFVHHIPTSASVNLTANVEW